MLSIFSVSDLSEDLANSLKNKRKWLKHSRDKASELSGVPSGFKSLFSIPKARTIDELIKNKKL